MDMLNVKCNCDTIVILFYLFFYHFSWRLHVLVTVSLL